MASISPIGYTPNFKGTAKTDKGNEYQTSNTGKIVGTTSGAVLGGLNILRANKLYDKLVKNMDENIKKLGDTDLTKAFKSGNKIGKGFLTACAALGSLILVVVGFFAGKVFDNKQNEKRAKAADKAA